MKFLLSIRPVSRDIYKFGPIRRGNEQEETEKTEKAETRISRIITKILHSVSSLPIAVLSVVEGLPAAANHNAITCSWVWETPAISTCL